jgi:outer membrane protein
MKKNLLASFVFVCILIFSAKAQTEQGSIMLGGSANLNIPTNDNTDGYNFTLNPTVGFFLIDNLAIGAGLPITSSRTEYNNNGNVDKRSSIGIAPFVRYYLGASNAKLFFQGRFGIQHFTAKNEVNGREINKSSDDAVFAGLGVGVAFFLNEHVGLEPSLTYDAYNRGTYNNSAFNINVGFQIYLPSGK